MNGEECQILLDTGASKSYIEDNAKFINILDKLLF